MSEQPSVRNELSGNVKGNVVQTGAIHGDVTFNPSATPISQESRELHRRLEDRQRRLLDAEDAQRAEEQRTFTRYLKVIRSKRRRSVLLGLFAGVAVVLGHLRVLSVMAEVLGLLFGAITVYGWAACTVTIRRAESGRTIRIPRSRWMW